MLKKLIVTIFLGSVHLVFSQGEANNWYFGYSAGINFDNDSGTVSNISNPNIGIKTKEGCSTFSDSEGHLLFYSDGKVVWNASNDIMPNGKGMLGNSSSTQSAMIIPKPLSKTQYYIFTVGSFVNWENECGLNYYTVDLTADGGKGDVIAGPIDLSGELSEDWTEKVASVEGAECNTYWVVSYDGTNIKSYKISASGVSDTPAVSFAPSPEKDRRGYLKISPNGKKLAIAHFIYKTSSQTAPMPGGDSSLYLFDFDDSTGKATNGIRLFDDKEDRIHPYGIEFSR